MTRTFDQTLQSTGEHFREHGWMRVPQAFDPGAASAMRDAVWHALAEDGIDRDRPESWNVERPVHLQRLKHDPVFHVVGSEVLLAVIDSLFEGRVYDLPRTWGAHFVAFPTRSEWSIPTAGWHIDANCAGAIWPLRGVKTFALLSDVEPRGGGTLILSGSHRLVHDWLQRHPPPPAASNADMRRILRRHPYIRDLQSPGDAGERIQRFMAHREDAFGIPLRVTEATGEAGDVILAHPLLMHVAAPNNSAQPRFLLSGGITTDQWGWAPAD